MEYQAHTSNAVKSNPTRLLDSSLLCMKLLKLKRRVLRELKKGDSNVQHQLLKKLQPQIRELVQNPPKQHTTEGKPAYHVFKVLETIGAGGQATVVAVQRMRHMCSTKNMYESDYSSQNRVMKIFTSNNPEDVHYAAQEVAASWLGIGSCVLQASDVGIVWLKYGHEAQAQPALAMLMPRLDEGTLEDLIHRWQGASAMKPSAPYVLKMAFDLLLGLVTMHQRGVVHRDIKPANIGITKGRLVALDLGLARFDVGDDGALARHSAVMGTYGYMSPDMNLAALELALQQQMLELNAAIRKEQSQNNKKAVQMLEDLHSDYNKGMDELKKLGPDFVCKTDTYSYGILLLQMVTYGKPPFWMILDEDKSPKDAQDEVFQLWVKYGPKTLLESSYWDPRTKADYPIIMELDDLLLDLVSQALAPHWRRPSAQELAAHSLFQPLGTWLVQELETEPLEEDASHLEYLLCCWSTYHPEAAKQLCDREVAAEVLYCSADREVQMVAKKACKRFEALSLGADKSKAQPNDSVLTHSSISVRTANKARDQELRRALRAKLSQQPDFLHLATIAAAERTNSCSSSATESKEPSGAGTSGLTKQAPAGGAGRSSRSTGLPPNSSKTHQGDSSSSMMTQDVPDASRPEADERGRQPKSLGGVACQETYDAVQLGEVGAYAAADKPSGPGSRGGTAQSSGEGVGRSSRSAVPDAGVERSSRSTAFQRGSSKARHDGSSCGVMTQVMLDASEPQADQSGWQHGSLGYDISQETGAVAEHSKIGAGLTHQPSGPSSRGGAAQALGEGVRRSSSTADMGPRGDTLQGGSGRGHHGGSSSSSSAQIASDAGAHSKVEPSDAAALQEPVGAGTSGAGAETPTAQVPTKRGVYSGRGTKATPGSDTAGLGNSSSGSADEMHDGGRAQATVPEWQPKGVGVCQQTSDAAERDESGTRSAVDKPSGPNGRGDTAQAPGEGVRRSSRATAQKEGRGKALQDGSSTAHHGGSSSSRSAQAIPGASEPEADQPGRQDEGDAVLEATRAAVERNKVGSSGKAALQKPSGAGTSGAGNDASTAQARRGVRSGQRRGLKINSSKGSPRSSKSAAKAGSHSRRGSSKKHLKKQYEDMSDKAYKGASKVRDSLLGSGAELDLTWYRKSDHNTWKVLFLWVGKDSGGNELPKSRETRATPLIEDEREEEKGEEQQTTKVTWSLDHLLQLLLDAADVAHGFSKEAEAAALRSAAEVLATYCQLEPLAPETAVAGLSE